MFIENFKIVYFIFKIMFFYVIVFSVYTLYNLPLIVGQCTDVFFKGPMECNDIKAVLDYHNQMRSDCVSGVHLEKFPIGKNMFALKWKPSLQEVAQEYANQCVFEHNKKRPENTGENLAQMGSSKKKMQNPIVQLAKNLFVKEYYQYSYEDPSSSNGTVGHLTQMIWASTLSVGCGVSFYKEAASEFYTTFLVCNYEPAGNYVGRKPYLAAASPTCDNNLYYTAFPGLCAQDDEHAKGDYDPCDGSGVKIHRASFLLILLMFLSSIYHHENLKINFL